MTDANPQQHQESDMSHASDCAIYNAPALPVGPCDCGSYGDLTPQEQLAVAGLNAAIDLAHATAVNAGWYRNPQTGEEIKRNFGEVIALMHSELSEALEADRKDLMDDKLPHRKGIEVELADCLIRIFDTSRALGLDLAGAVIEKNRFNRERADHKLAARAAGGKKY